MVIGIGHGAWQVETGPALKVGRHRTCFKGGVVLHGLGRQSWVMVIEDEHKGTGHGRGMARTLKGGIFPKGVKPDYVISPGD
jgi:hypothetical protein